MVKNVLLALAINVPLMAYIIIDNSLTDS